MNRFKLIAFCLLLTMSKGVFGQQNVIDSLKELTTRVYGGELVDVYKELSFKYMDFDNGEALRYGMRALSMAQCIGDSQKIATSYRLLGGCYRRLDRFDSALLFFQHGLEIARRNELFQETGRMLNSLGVVHTFSGSYGNALMCLLEARDLAVSVDDVFYEQAILSNIGFAYYKMSNYRQAAYYYEESLRLKEASQETFHLGGLMVNIGLCYVFLGDLTTARRWVRKAYHACGARCNDVRSGETLNFLMEVKYCEGTIAFYSGNFNAARGCFLMSREFAQITNHIRFLIENDVYLSKIYLRNDKASALRCLKGAEQTASQTKHNLLKIQIYNQLSDYYYNVKDYKNASAYQDKYIHLRDSIFNHDLTQQLMVAQTEYDQKANKSKINQQSKILSMREDIIDRNKTISVLVVLAVILLLALVVAMLRSGFLKRNAIALLEMNVKSRTNEVEHNYTVIEKSYQTQQSLVQKTIADMRALANTISGLANVPALSATRRGIEAVSEQLLMIVAYTAKRRRHE